MVNINKAHPMPPDGTTDAPEPSPIRRLGFMEDQFAVPDDFDQIDADEIEKLFYGE